MRELSKLMAPLARRIRLMASRAVVGVVNDALKLQGLQISLLADETRDKVERFQNYGFTSVPHAGAEAITIALGGSRDHLAAIAVDDRRYRLKNLADGEVAVYDDLGHQVHLTRNGIVIHGAGHQVLITGTPKLRVEADIEATGEIKDRCESDGMTMEGMRNTYNGHTHGGGTTPSPAM